MLVEGHLMIVGVELASNGTRLLVHWHVKVEQILGHQVQEMSQALCLCSLPVLQARAYGTS